jgi:glycosyltransferase involved in cell wall biosynthesis
VGIDLTALLPTTTGVETYLKRLVRSLSDVDGTTRYTLFVNREDLELFSSGFGDNFRVIGGCLRPRSIRLLFQQAVLPAAALMGGIDVVHSPSFIMPMVRAGRRHLLTVYDMTFFSHPECHIPLRRSRPYLKAIIASLRRADMVTVPSESTKREILRCLPGMDAAKIRVVVPGINDEFKPMPPRRLAAAADTLGLSKPYVLYVGTLEPRKNLLTLVDAFHRLVEEHDVEEDLVLAGKAGWGYEPLFERIRDHGLDDRIHRLGYVPQELMPGLVGGAKLFVYPSLAEGFGFPPLEAMACGVPTIASDSTSLAENLDGAAVLVSPHDPVALGEAMVKVLKDEPVRNELRQKGLDRARSFRWEQTARETVACYRELMSLSTSI